MCMFVFIHLFSLSFLYSPLRHLLFMEHALGSFVYMSSFQLHFICQRTVQVLWDCTKFQWFSCHSEWFVCFPSEDWNALLGNLYTISVLWLRCLYLSISRWQVLMLCSISVDVAKIHELVEHTSKGKGLTKTKQLCDIYYGTAWTMTWVNAQDNAMLCAFFDNVSST